MTRPESPDGFMPEDDASWRVDIVEDPPPACRKCELYADYKATKYQPKDSDIAFTMRHDKVPHPQYNTEDATRMLRDANEVKIPKHLRASYYLNAVEGIGLPVPDPHLVLEGRTAGEIAKKVEALILADKVDGDYLRLLMLGVELGKAEAWIRHGV